MVGDEVELYEELHRTQEVQTLVPESRVSDKISVDD